MTTEGQIHRMGVTGACRSRLGSSSGAGRRETEGTRRGGRGARLLWTSEQIKSEQRNSHISPVLGGIELSGAEVARDAPPVKHHRKSRAWATWQAFSWNACYDLCRFPYVRTSFQCGCACHRISRPHLKERSGGKNTTTINLSLCGRQGGAMAYGESDEEARAW